MMKSQVELQLISHVLCPYVQRSVIVLLEKGISFQRTNIDLAHKPDWFKALSPTGKVPLLLVDNQHRIFESTIICEYLEEISAHKLLPTSAVDKAVSRAWIEYASVLLNSIGQFYSSKNESEFNLGLEKIQKQLSHLEQFVENTWRKSNAGKSYFNGESFSMVDAAFAPAFRYFDVFKLGGIDMLAGSSSVTQWQNTLRQRPSVQSAVASAYPAMLVEFIQRKRNYFSKYFPEELTSTLQDSA